jgi:2-polyprenyl-6-methoxyphenol hydroxylase-like FAD-dependent oxidoreductase
MVDFDKTYDVVIVGGGPVGMGLAIDLGQRGHSVAVIERQPNLHTIPKGQNLTQRTMEHFQAWGCETKVRAARVVPRDYAIGGMTSYRTLLSGYHYDWMQRGLVAPFYNAANERLPQYQTEKALRERVEELSQIHVSYGVEAIGLEQGAEAATVSVTNRDGATRHLTGRFVVGADGARSAVRDLAGITQTCAEHDKRMVLLVFKSTDLHKLLERYPGKQFYCILTPELQGYWMFFGRVDLGTTWFFHAPVPADTTRDNFDFKAHLERAVGSQIDVSFDHIGFWDLRIALADTYQAGRVFIAGDACHSHPPYGGYGVNTGLEDARNLGWKLSSVLQGWGGESILDSYTQERHPVFKSTADHFIERFIIEDRDFLNAHDPAEEGEAAFRAAWDARGKGAPEVTAFAPNYDGGDLVWGNDQASPSAQGTQEFRARAGHHLAPRTLNDGTNAYDHLGAGFTLFGHTKHEAILADFRASAAKAGIPLEIITDQDCDAFTDWRAELVLVRPDSYVAWTGPASGLSASQILARVIGQSRDAI